MDIPDKEDFSETLRKIEETKQLYKNPKLFIKKRNLIPFPTKLHISSKDLPIQLGMGTVYFIHKNSILESYSWVDYNYSLSVAVNYHQPAWLNEVHVHNLDPNDFNYDFYCWMKDNPIMRIRDKPSDLDSFAVNLVNSGCKIWLHKQPF